MAEDIQIRPEGTDDYGTVLHPETNAGNVLTSDGSTVQVRINELFQSVSSGKQLVAAAITDKGILTNGSDTFATMSSNISKINTSKYRLSKISTYELMMRYNFDPVIALGLQPGGN